MVRQSYDASAADRRRLEHWDELLRRPNGLSAWAEDMLGAQVGAMVERNPSPFEDIRANLIAGIKKARALPRGPLQQRWAISERWQGIQRAGLVVVNVRHQDQRGSAEQLVQDVLRLRREPELFDDILGWRGSRIPITAVAADLQDPNDAGRKKAVARVRRVVLSRPLW